jgi:hypothetical protein
MLGYREIFIAVPFFRSLGKAVLANNKSTAGATTRDCSQAAQSDDGSFQER